ncbi:MAG: hypothetical protein NTV06_03925, partial [candidate division Zixibacteria bacterium]|nr:hypothetical protein [candidate division Zixibacteria bacterium]
MIEEKKETETEIVDAESKTPKGLSKLVGLKKYILPASIAAGVFILAIVGSSLLMKKNPATDGETVVPTDEQTKVTKDSTISGKEGTFDSLFTDIDTVEVMKQLDFLFYNPDEKIDSQKAAISKDSVDTLNWIQRETAKLETEKAAIEKQ